MRTETPSRETAVRKFPRGFARLMAIALGAVALYAVLGFFVVPPIVRSQGVKLARTKLHREAKITRVQFNPFTLAGIVEGLTLKDRDGADLFTFDRLVVNFQVSSLFRRTWTFREITIEGPAPVLRILTDGRPSIIDLFEGGEPETPQSAGKPLPRISIETFALRSGRAEFVDESRSPRFNQTLAPLDLEVHHLSTIPDHTGEHAITIGLGDATLRWSGRQSLDPMHLEGRVEIEGISLARVGEYLASTHPLVIRDGRADVACSYEVRRETSGPVAVVLKGAGLTVRDLVVRPREGAEDWLTVPIAEVRDVQAEWPRARVEVGGIRVTGPRVLARRGEDGSVNWLPAIAGFRDTGEATRSSSPSWTAEVDLAEITGGSVRFEDRLVEPDVTTSIAGVELRLERLSTDLSAAVKARVAARINEGGEVTATGTLAPDPLEADLRVELRGVDLTPFEPYAVRLPGAEFRRGLAGLEGKLRIAPGSPSARFDGNAWLQDLHVAGAGAERLIAWDRADARGVRVTVGPERVRIAKIETDGAFLKLFIDRQGAINLSQLLASGGPPETGAPPPTRVPESVSGSLPLEIGTITFRNAIIDYTDESLILPFGTKIHTVSGTIRDLSTTQAAAARLAMEGRVAEMGYVKAEGTLRVADPFASTDVGVIFRGIPMPDLTPYTAHFAGYAVKQGLLDLDVRYRIQDRRLVGDHRIVATDLVLGSKVEGAEGPGLPVRLAIALLKDKDGRIDLEVPIEGTVDSPEFAYRKVFWQAFKKILVNIVKAPFRAIGRLFGADQEDLELVGFASGRSDLLAPEAEKLSKLASELAGRSEISLEIEGRFDPLADVESLRRARLEQRIDQRRVGDANLEAILEALFSETFSAERLEAERGRFMPQPEARPVVQESTKKRKKEAVPPPTPPRTSFDAAGFYDALRAQLLASEPVGEEELADLARARAGAITAALTASGALDASRVKVLEPSPVKRKKQGSDLVASEMTMSAED